MQHCEDSCTTVLSVSETNDQNDRISKTRVLSLVANVFITLAKFGRFTGHDFSV